MQARLLYTLGLLFLLTPSAKADFFIHSWEDQYTPTSDLRFESLYYYSSSNFDSLGTPSYFSGLQYYARLQEDLIIRHAFFNRISLFGRLAWSFGNVLGSSRAGNGYGLADQSVGITVRIYEGQGFSLADTSGSIDLQGQVDFPAYNNAQADLLQTPYPGDGTVDGTAGIFLTLPLWSHGRNLVKTVLGAGYTYRNNGFSAAFPWSFALKYIHRKGGLFFDLLSSGFMSQKTDSSGLLYGGRSSVGTGGSLFTGAANASLIQVGGRFGYKAGNHFEIYVGGSQSLWGQTAPNGYVFSGGLSLHLGAQKEADPTHATPEDYGQTNQGFLNYSLDAKVLKANDRLNLVKIDKGGQDGIEIGQIFDIFAVAQNGSPKNAVARAEVTSVKPEESVLSVQEFYKEVWIDEGFLAKRLVR